MQQWTARYPRYAEVKQLGPPRACHKHVRRLQVAVDHVVVVRVAQRRTHILDDRPRMAEGHAAAKLLIEQRIERLALKVFHQQVQPLAVHIHRMHVDDVRMAELARLADFLA